MKRKSLRLAFLVAFLNPVFSLTTPLAGQEDKAYQSSLSKEAENIMMMREAEQLQQNEINQDVWVVNFERYRSGHHLSLFFGKASGSWKLAEIGDGHDGMITSDGSLYKLQYDYHLRIMDNFGYFVGSSMEFFSSNDRHPEKFKEGSSARLPSVVLGLSFDIGWKYMIFSWVDYSIDLYKNIEFRGKEEGVSEDRVIGITMNGTQAFAGFKFFFESTSSLVFAYGLQFLEYAKPNNMPEKENHPLHISLLRKQQRLLVGYSYHLF